MACPEIWDAIVRLWARYPQPEYPKQLAVYFVQGLGCVPELHTGAFAAEMARYKDGLTVDSVFLSECGAATQAQVYLESAAVTVGFAPRRPGRFVEIRSKVLELLSRRYVVLLMGGSYGGLVATRVAESLADHALAGELYLRTFGSIYVTRNPSLLPRTTNYAYAFDSIATDRTGLAPPGVHDARAVFDPETRTVWLKHLDHATRPTESAALNKIHQGYKAVILNESGYLRDADMADPDVQEDLENALMIDWRTTRRKRERHVLRKLMRDCVRSFVDRGVLETDAHRLADALAKMVVDDAYGDAEPVSLAKLEALRAAAAAAPKGPFRLSMEQYVDLVIAFFHRGLNNAVNVNAINKMVAAVQPGAEYDADFW
jgi:hypothetical protein